MQGGHGKGRSGAAPVRVPVPGPVLDVSGRHVIVEGCVEGRIEEGGEEGGEEDAGGGADEDAVGSEGGWG
ncbi:hypothetical protein ACFYQA_25985 [Streptomyces sp. NPDC005774]|uniref:hypothetical protein n=1 Tax=Streptomyces sp. NPDC005774 TaxID=3364728 RepID=UPI0036939F6C